MHKNGFLTLSRRHARLVALLLAGALVTPMISGCGADASTADNSGEQAETTATQVTKSDTSATTDTHETPTFDFSAGIDENGHWTGVKALDYVKLPSDYKSISIPASEVTPTDEEVQSMISSITSGYATLEQVTDRAVADGDTVNIDYVGSVDGTEFEGGSTQGNGTVVTIGVTQYIDDFLDQLVGHKPGETFDVNVTFPEEYGVEELNGKDAVFSVTINYIQETKQPDVTDEWVEKTLKGKYGWTTVAEMDKEIRDGLQYKHSADYVRSYVLENSEVSEIPASIVDQQAAQLVYQYEYYANMYGTDLASFLKMSAGVETTDELVEKNKESLADAAKVYLVFQAVAEDAGIEVTPDELTNYLTSVSGNSDTTSLEAKYGKGYLALQALVQKTGEYLVSQAVVTDDASTADAEKAENANADTDKKADSDAASGKKADADKAEDASGKDAAADKSGDSTAKDSDTERVESDSAAKEANADKATSGTSAGKEDNAASKDSGTSANKSSDTTSKDSDSDASTKAAK